MWARLFSTITCTMLDLLLGEFVIILWLMLFVLNWATNEEIGFVMKVIDKGLIEELKLQNTKKRLHTPVTPGGTSRSRGPPIHSHFDSVERELRFQRQELLL